MSQALQPGFLLDEAKFKHILTQGIYTDKYVLDRSTKIMIEGWFLMPGQCLFSAAYSNIAASAVLGVGSTVDNKNHYRLAGPYKEKANHTVFVVCILGSTITKQNSALFC